MVDCYRGRDKRIDIDDCLRLCAVNVPGQVVKFKSRYCDDAGSCAVGCWGEECGVSKVLAGELAYRSSGNQNIFNFEILG